jgi:hypothetical protein
MDEAMEAVRVAGDDLLGSSPMFVTPQGATTKKLVDSGRWHHRPEQLPTDGGLFVAGVGCAVSAVGEFAKRVDRSRLSPLPEVVLALGFL